MTKSKRSVEVSEITFYPIMPTAKGLVCYTSFTYQNSLRIQDCGIYTRPTGGYRILYPIKYLANGKTVSSVYPINKEVGCKIEDFLLCEYEKLLKKGIKDEGGENE
jgi:DNA-binding cell septation regulator SpoVG